MLVCSICVRQAKHALFLLRVSFSLPYHLAALFAQLLLSFFFSHSLSYGLRPPTFSKKKAERVREKEQINSTRRKENNQPVERASQCACACEICSSLSVVATHPSKMIRIHLVYIL